MALSEEEKAVAANLSASDRLVFVGLTPEQRVEFMEGFKNGEQEQQGKEISSFISTIFNKKPKMKEPKVSFAKIVIFQIISFWIFLTGLYVIGIAIVFLASKDITRDEYEAIAQMGILIVGIWGIIRPTIKGIFYMKKIKRWLPAIVGILWWLTFMFIMSYLFMTEFNKSAGVGAKEDEITYFTWFLAVFTVFGSAFLHKLIAKIEKKFNDYIDKKVTNKAMKNSTSTIGGLA